MDSVSKNKAINLAKEYSKDGTTRFVIFTRVWHGESYEDTFYISLYNQLNWNEELICYCTNGKIVECYDE